MKFLRGVQVTKNEEQIVFEYEWRTIKMRIESRFETLEERDAFYDNLNEDNIDDFLL